MQLYEQTQGDAHVQTKGTCRKFQIIELPRELMNIVNCYAPTTLPYFMEGYGYELMMFGRLSFAIVHRMALKTHR